MKKQTLLGAIALTTLAVGAAGAANAQQYTHTQVAATGATVTATLAVASEIKLDGAANKGSIGIALVPSVGASLPGGNSVITYTLTGGHTFGTAVTGAAIVANAPCSPTATVSSGGAIGDSTVSFLVSNFTGCSNTQPIHATLPVLLGNTTTAVGITSTFKTELGTNIDGGSAVKTNLITFGKAFAVTVAADTAATAATLASGFKSLSADKTLGTIALAVTANATVLNTATPVAAALSDITNASFKFVGSQSAVGASLSLVETAGPVTTAVPVATGVVADASPTAAYTVNAVAGTGVIPASTYTVATDLTLNAKYNAQATYGPSALQAISREGSTFLIPWVGSGASAQATGNQTVIRISNIGTAATGQVSAELLNSSTGTGAVGAFIAINGSIPAGKDFVITGASLQSNFGGTDFGRGDVRITVEANAADLIARRFIQNVTGGSVSEVSMGRSLTSSVVAAGAGTIVTTSEPIN